LFVAVCLQALEFGKAWNHLMAATCDADFSCFGTLGGGAHLRHDHNQHGVCRICSFFDPAFDLESSSSSDDNEIIEEHHGGDGKREEKQDENGDKRGGSPKRHDQRQLRSQKDQTIHTKRGDVTPPSSEELQGSVLALEVLFFQSGTDPSHKYFSSQKDCTHTVVAAKLKTKNGAVSHKTFSSGKNGLLFGVFEVDSCFEELETPRFCGNLTKPASTWVRPENAFAAAGTIRTFFLSFRVRLH
jgi:hypothetical protein